MPPYKGAPDADTARKELGNGDATGGAHHNNLTWETLGWTHVFRGAAKRAAQKNQTEDKTEDPDKGKTLMWTLAAAAGFKHGPKNKKEREAAAEQEQAQKNNKGEGQQ